MTEAQPDLLGSEPSKAKKRAAPSKPAPKKAVAKAAPKKAAPKPGTAVAVDDPAKRQHVAQQQPASLGAAIIQAITDPRCDPAKMHSLLDFQERLDAREAKRAFDEAFGNLQAELPVIRADRKIEIRAKDNRGERTGAVQQSTPYATFPGIMKAIQPLLTKNGLRLSFRTTPMDPIIVGDSVMERILVTGILSGHGHERTTDFAVRPDNSGSKNPTQAQGSGQSYGKRYCTIALLNIISEAMEDADTDGHGGNFVRAKGGGLAESTEVETLTDEEEAALNRKMVACKVPLEKVLTHYKIKTLHDLPRNLLATATKQCDDYAENQKRVAAERDSSSGFPGDRPLGGARGR